MVFQSPAPTMQNPSVTWPWTWWRSLDRWKWTRILCRLSLRIFSWPSFNKNKTFYALHMRFFLRSFVPEHLINRVTFLCILCQNSWTMRTQNYCFLKSYLCLRVNTSSSICNEEHYTAISRKLECVVQFCFIATLLLSVLLERSLEKWIYTE